MRQKITWFIPGLLVTLLLGLLWAMPAFGQEAGEIEFLNAKGGKAVSHVSLNGPAAETNGFWIQITDADLNKPVAKTVSFDLAAVTRGTAPNDVSLPAASSYDWSNLADSNSDDVLNYKDFVGYVDTNANGKLDSGEASRRFGTVVESVTFGLNVLNLDTQSGTLVQGTNTTAPQLPVTAADGTVTDTAIDSIQFMIFEQEIIGARSGTDQTARFEVDGGTVGDDVLFGDTPLDTSADVSTGDGAYSGPSLGIVDGDDNTLTWTELLSSRIPTLLTAKYDTTGKQNALKSQVEGLISANNEDENVPLKDEATITYGTDSTNEATYQKVTSISVTISSDCPTAEAGATGCNSRTGAHGPWALNATNDAWESTDTTNTDVNIVVNVGTSGSSTNVYSLGHVGVSGEVGRVVVSSNNHSISVLVQETDATTGVFGTTVRICDADDCKISQANEVTNGLGQVVLPVDPSGDTIRVAYRDASPSTTRRASIALDVNPPALSNFSPESGAAGSDDEPEIAFDVVDSESGISAFDKKEQTPKESIQAVVALYETDGTKFAGPVTFTRGDLSDDAEITGGFSVGFEVREGSSGDLVLDNGDRSQYEIRWWAVAMDQSGNTGVSDQKKAVSLTGTVKLSDSADPEAEVDDDNDLVYVHGTKTKFDDEIKPGDTITIGGETRVVINDGRNTDSRLRVDAPFKEGASAASATTGDCIPTQFAFPDGGSITLAGCDPNVIRVDTQSPTMTGAVTGTVLGDDNKPNAANSLTSIQVTFDEALDCNSVTADDFEVDGATPNAVSCFGNSVYLSVDEMDRDDKPEVELVGAVMDKAGNVLDSEDDENLRTQDAADGIGAQITATVTGTGEGDRPVTDRTVTVMVSSDERLASSPTVEIRKVGRDYSLGNPVSGNAVPTGNANEWSFERNFTVPGLYNVFVSGNNVGSASKGSTDGLSGQVLDSDGNPVTPERYSLNKDTIKDDGIILFEVDTGVAAPDFDPADEGTTDDPNVLIRIDFADEGKEYGLKAAECKKDADNDTETAPDYKSVDDEGKCGDGYTKTEAGDVSTSASEITDGVDFDTSPTVEVTKATFNGDDVTESVSSRDGVLFVFRPGNLTLGVHKLEIEATDTAGNDGKGKSFTAEFEVTERKAYTIELNPGPNLVSFPADPADGDINAVFGGSEDIMSVLTYDNETQLWMTATKGADGSFSGDLTTVNGMNGYWVVSDSLVDVSVILEAGADFQPPPHIAVTKGWNLIGVVDADQAEAGTPILAKDYFANIDAEVVYGYDSRAGRLVRLSVGDTSEDEVVTGAAYWVYANESGIIVP